MEIAEHLRALEDAGHAFADLVAGTPPATPIPTCPGWDVSALTRHLGTVHRWAATIVETPMPEQLRFDSFEDALAKPEPQDLIPWFGEGHGTLVRALRRAPPDLDCWTFLAAPSPRAFWCRRQAHETAMHLVDLALTCGLPAEEAPPAFAADGIDELLRGWLRGRPPHPGEDDAPRLRLVATDVALDWQVGFPGSRGATIVLGEEAMAPPGCTVRGPAISLYLLLWNRRTADGLDVSGDPDVLRAWAEGRHVG